MRSRQQRSTLPLARVVIPKRPNAMSVVETLEEDGSVDFRIGMV